MMDLKERYLAVLARVEEAEQRAGRPANSVKLLAVGKGRAVAELQALYDLGQRSFGENRAQELARKMDQLPGDIDWHFVGPLQTNKVRLVRPVVRLLHSLDRESLAEAWMKGPGRPPPALLQVNIGREPQKGGVEPEQVMETATRFLALGIPLLGLMAIPPLAREADEARPYFRHLASLAGDLHLLHPEAVELSMGMSDDFEVAIEEGATVIRLGRAIFSATD